MNLPQADRKKLGGLLDELAGAVEELLLSGLTTASEATRQKLGIAFQEASRMRLLRLGSTLRVANEELGRFTRNQADFSRRRLSFFLNRAWLLSRGLSKALAAGDEQTFDRLLWNPVSAPVEHLEVVTVGVGKKVVAGAFCAFEFRLRTVKPAGKIEAGRRLSWSCLFPLKPGVEIPAEGFLHLPQKQKFTASIFLEAKVINVDKGAAALDEHGGGRLRLTDQSTVALGDEYSDWESLQHWDREAALRRIQAHQTGPFDLEIEIQEEVVLDDWQVGEPSEHAEDGQWAYPIESGTTTFEAMVSAGVEGAALRDALDKQRKKKRRPPLFGLMHYERCRLVLQPLTVFGKEGPEHLMLSDEKIDRATLLKALKF